jgi:hypothetical protein
MKRIALVSLGIGAIAAVSLPATYRTASAAANGHICTSNGGSSGCPSGNLYGINISSLDTVCGSLASANAKLSNSFVTVTCTDSETTQKSNSDGSSSSFSKFEFDNGTPTTPCSSNLFPNQTAAISVIALPSGFTINWGATCVQGKTGCDGTITINNVDEKITFSGGSTCTVTGSPTGNVYNKGNANAPVGGASAAHTELDFPGVSLTLSGSLCGTSGTETATGYLVGNNPAGTDIYLTA